MMARERNESEDDLGIPDTVRTGITNGPRATGES